MQSPFCGYGTIDKILLDIVAKFLMRFLDIVDIASNMALSVH